MSERFLFFFSSAQSARAFLPDSGDWKDVNEMRQNSGNGIEQSRTQKLADYTQEETERGPLVVQKPFIILDVALNYKGLSTPDFLYLCEPVNHSSNSRGFLMSFLG